jgi:hypothetical protein
MESIDHDLLDRLLVLEDKFYTEGYDLGVNDGAHAGYTEGGVFAIEKSFEKFLEMGRLYGKAVVWAKRLPGQPDLLLPANTSLASADAISKQDTKSQAQATTAGFGAESLTFPALRDLPANPRLVKHIKILLTLVDPLTVSTENMDVAVSDFDGRFKKASAKAKIIEKILEEGNEATTIQSSQKSEQSTGIRARSGNIEDIGPLPARFSQTD